MSFNLTHDNLEREIPKMFRSLDIKTTTDFEGFLDYLSTNDWKLADLTLRGEGIYKRFIGAGFAYIEGRLEARASAKDWRK
jgi:hypothetical protein